MNLLTRIALIGILLIALQVIGLVLLAQYWIVPQCDQVQSDLTEKKLTRGAEILQRELYHLQQIAEALSQDNNINAIIEDPNELLKLKITDQLPIMMYNFDLNMLYIVDKQKRVLWEKIIDIQHDQSYPKTMTLSKMWNNYPALLQHDSLLSVQAGFYQSQIGPMMLVSTPIASTGFPPKVAGTLIVAKIINADFLKYLSNLSLSPIQVWPQGDEAFSPAHQAIFDRLKDSKNRVLIEHYGDFFKGYIFLNNLSGQPTFLLSVSTHFPIATLFKQYFFSAVGIIILLESLLIILALHWISKRHLQPLRALSDQINQLEPNKVLVPGVRSDKEFNFLLHALQGFIARQFLNLNRETTLAYRRGCYQTRKIMLQGFDKTTRLFLEGLVSIEKQLTMIPTKEIAWIVSRLLTDKAPKEPKEQLKHYANKLTIVNDELAQYQKETRQIVIELQKKALRNAAVVRAHSRKPGESNISPTRTPSK